MKHLKILIKSNNKKASVQLMSFLNEKLKTNKFTLQKISLKTLNKHKFTLLKSPNINKTAQEKFEKTTLNIQIMFAVTKYLQSLHFLKQLTHNFSSDCCIFLKYKVICKYNLVLRPNIFSPVIIKNKKYNTKTTNNVYFNFIKKNKILFLLKIFSISGEFFKNQL